ncbi:UDP-2,4-diacetamido-2,4,6-trideoxy-beta-L-altropyranose hydrolase [Pontibacter rugosus]|uniref:UDP-2,4-diacetamido-2,4, 6-trideoxy-beta-L-altropyranose hydrolase n=1 Tax=Pontibacter rugosus TaxID=1745966 RepID=A0ABW3SRE5_9BACT
MGLSKESKDVKQRIIFRADGNSQIGLGHVVRSLALAEMLREEFECIFAIQSPSKDLREQIQHTCHGLIALPACTPAEDRFTHELDAYISKEEIVVLDGYNFNTNYQLSIKAKGAALICIDDIHTYSFVADAVLNQAGGVKASLYTTSPYTKLLLGTDYALLRQPFMAAARQTRHQPAAPLQLLVSLGGADPANYTLKLAKELADTCSAQVNLVVGGAYQHLEELQQWLALYPAFALHRNLTADQMCRLMCQCAVAVTSSSGVAYEYAAVGGILYVLQTADNQAGLYSFLTENGIALRYEELKSHLSNRSLEELFREQVQIQRRYIDGYSDDRLREIFRRLSLATDLTFREVTEGDLLLVYEWNNDPEVRRRSFDSATILLESHTRWFKDKLADPHTVIYIAEVKGKPAAQIRFKVQNTTATLGYLISAEFRGKGLGHILLSKGVEQLLAQNPGILVVEGLVQRDNIASVRAFEKAGFTYGKPNKLHPDAHRFILEVKV